MARRKKTSPADDIVDLIAMLPWWIGVAVALVSYLWLHSVAAQSVMMDTTPGHLSNALTITIWKGLATPGQYILPFLCLLGAGISAYRRHQRKTLIANVGNSHAADALDGITWQEFEILVGESFRRQGYQVTEKGGGGADGGIDLMLRKGSEKFFVQCKQWKAFTVGVTVVRELYGVMAAKGAAGGFVVTSGKFTAEATDFAKGRNITLVDGPTLTTMIRAAKGANNKGATAASVKPSPAPAMPTEARSVTPSCPVCSKTMVQRTAKKGVNAGQVFWGCSGYPACRGTRPIS
jgi:restriction system protein